FTSVVAAGAYSGFVGMEAMLGGQLIAINSDVITSTNASAIIATGIMIRARSHGRLARNRIEALADSTTATRTGIQVAGVSSVEAVRNRISTSSQNGAAVRSLDGNHLVLRGNTFRSGNEGTTATATAFGVSLGADVALVAGNLFIDNGARNY